MKTHARIRGDLNEIKKWNDPFFAWILLKRKEKTEKLGEFHFIFM